jgi:hypothetical protein
MYLNVSHRMFHDAQTDGIAKPHAQERVRKTTWYTPIQLIRLEDLELRHMLLIVQPIHNA